MKNQWVRAQSRHHKSGATPSQGHQPKLGVFAEVSSGPNLLASSLKKPSTAGNERHQGSGETICSIANTSSLIAHQLASKSEGENNKEQEVGRHAGRDEAVVDPWGSTNPTQTAPNGATSIEELEQHPLTCRSWIL